MSDAKQMPKKNITELDTKDHPPTSGMLTPSEMESLKQKANAAHDYFQKAFDHLRTKKDD